jgi:hypothetical protein
VDFTLIALDEGANEFAHPQAISIPGPTGFIDCLAVDAGDRFSYHGYGIPWGVLESTRTRTGILTSCDRWEYAGQTNVSGGDSGAPVIHESGAALGIASRFGTTTNPPATLTGPTIPYILKELGKAGFDGIALATVDGGYAR